jgi:hypothetical protein
MHNLTKIFLLLWLLLCGCATTKTELERSLNLAMHSDRFSKQEAVAQVGQPQTKEPLAGGGESWIYTFNKVIPMPTGVSSGYVVQYAPMPIQLNITLKFSADGVFTGWAFKGDVSSFADEIARFRALKPRAEAAPAPTSEPPPEKNAIHELTLKKLQEAIFSGRVWEPTILKTIGVPQEIQPRTDAAGRQFLYHYQAPSADPAQPQRMMVALLFAPDGRLQGFSLRKLSGTWLLTPFTRLEAP